jgi:hypothetical protein
MIRKPQRAMVARVLKGKMTLSTHEEGVKVMKPIGKGYQS